MENDGDQQMEDPEIDVITVPKFTKLFFKAIDQFKFRIFFLFLERIYIIISMSIILVLQQLQGCEWNNLHYWAVCSLILYGQLFQLSNNHQIQQDLAIQYVQIVYVPINQVTDHPVAPEVFDPTANLTQSELKKKADVMQIQIRVEIAKKNQFCKYNNIFSNITVQGIFIWTIYFIVINSYEISPEIQECDNWPSIQIYIYGTFLFIQYSLYYILVVLTLIMLPFILSYLIIKCFKKSRQKQQALMALNELKKNKILYTPNIVQGDQECSICMQPYQTDDEILILPCNALHHFHNTCISAWLQIQPKCPNCNQQLLPDSLQPLLQQQQQQQQQNLQQQQLLQQIQLDL